MTTRLLILTGLVMVLGLAACSDGVLVALPAIHSTNPAATPPSSAGLNIVESRRPPRESSGSLTAADSAGGGSSMAGMDHSGTKGMAGMDHEAGTKGGMPMDHGAGGHDVVGKAGGQSGSGGAPGAANAAARTVQVAALDTMRFQPEKITVKSGETVRFVVSNQGKVRHEFVLATPDEQREHEAMMAAMASGKGAMEHHSGNAVTLDPGQTKTIVWRFPESGTVEFGCHEPGHYPAGMKGTAVVQG